MNKEHEQHVIWSVLFLLLNNKAHGSTYCKYTIKKTTYPITRCIPLLSAGICKYWSSQWCTRAILQFFLQTCESSETSELKCSAVVYTVKQTLIFTAWQNKCICLASPLKNTSHNNWFVAQSHIITADLMNSANTYQQWADSFCVHEQGRQRFMAVEDAVRHAKSCERGQAS